MKVSQITDADLDDVIGIRGKFPCCYPAASCGWLAGQRYYFASSECYSDLIRLFLPTCGCIDHVPRPCSSMYRRRSVLIRRFFVPVPRSTVIYANQRYFSNEKCLGPGQFHMPSCMRPQVPSPRLGAAHVFWNIYPPRYLAKPPYRHPCVVTLKHIPNGQRARRCSQG